MADQGQNKSTFSSLQNVSAWVKDCSRQPGHNLWHGIAPHAATRRSAMDTLFILVALATIVIPVLTEAAVVGFSTGIWRGL
jgi:hypothetical protein